MAKKANHVKVKDFEKKITIIAVMIVAGLIGAYTLGYSFAAKGGKGGKQNTSTSVTTHATDQKASDNLKGELVRQKGKKFWRTSGDSDPNTWNWQSLNYLEPTVGNYEVCFEITSSKSANLRLTSAVGGDNKGGQFAEDILIDYHGEPQVCRTIANQNDYSGTSSVMRYDLHIESSGTIDIAKSTLRKL